MFSRVESVRRVWHVVENALRSTSCEHVRRRHQSDECGSASMCKLSLQARAVHGRQRYLYKDCGGKGMN
jgi:hypothetical protein